ncbi:MAG: undecaprenyldiphospho-muramoylpentapeptide beta-N-acetylglucosaminyltransferase [Bdellovibrionota bacterium]
MWSQANSKCSLMIAGGGTGGHVLAGVAIADAWKTKFGRSARIMFVGAQGGIEKTLVPRAGYKLSLLKLGALKGVGIRRQIKTIVWLPLAFVRSIWIILRFRPAAVVGVGGYASGPLVLAACFFKFSFILKCKTAILEQNSVPGFTNRLLGKVVQHIFCAFPGSADGFSGGRATITGNPVRSSITRMPPASRDPFTILVFGGSQGSVPINTMVINSFPFLKDILGNIKFIHQTGEKDYDRVLAAHLDAGTNARVEKFIYDMPAAYQGASLVICRAGSSTLAEIAAVGRATILIPFPEASDEHQRKNAEVFAEAGAAKLLPQSIETATPASGGNALAALVRELKQDVSQIEKMEHAVIRFYRPEAAVGIVNTMIAAE